MPNIITEKTAYICKKLTLRDVTSGTCTVIVNMHFDILVDWQTIVDILKQELQAGNSNILMRL